MVDGLKDLKIEVKVDPDKALELNADIVEQQYETLVAAKAS